MLGSPIDAIGRSKRYHSSPRGEYTRITPKLLALLAFLFRHGPLPTNYLFAFYGTKSLKMFQLLLRRLYDGHCKHYSIHIFDEDENDITARVNPAHKCVVVQKYLTRPLEYRTANLYYDQVVYDLSDEARQLLRDSGIHCDLFSRRDPPVHRLMAACIGASLELACRDKYEYFSQIKILEKKRKPLDIGYLEPDLLAGITADGAQRFYQVEVTRSSEQKSQTEKASQSKRETIEGKLKNYDTFMHREDYLHHWGIKNSRILFATTSTAEGEAIRYFVHEKYPRLRTRVFTREFPDFSGTEWRIPKVYDDILEGWQSIDGEPFTLIKSAP